MSGARTVLVTNGPSEIDATIASVIIGFAAQGVTKLGQGTLSLTANNTYGGPTTSPPDV